jgi:hypothetical protein
MNSHILNMKVFCKAPFRIAFPIRNFQPPSCPHTLYNCNDIHGSRHLDIATKTLEDEA